MKKVYIVILLFVLTLTGCSNSTSNNTNSSNTNVAQTTLDALPEYDGSIYIELDNNKPEFSTKDKDRTDAFEEYSDLDSLGRCGVAYANICKELMPTEKRSSIGMIKPSGWQLAKYDSVDGKYLYNRSHLIGFQLAGENANEKNLITGTRYFNVDGMLPFENQVAEYVKNIDNHVLYRVTPIFKENELVARGVHMEAYSIEDNGKGVQFNVFVYNIQPGITIDYLDGTNSGEGKIVDGIVQDNNSKNSQSIIGNENTKIYHDSECNLLPKEDNRVYFNSKSEAKENGYKAHSSCVN